MCGYEYFMASLSSCSHLSKLWPYVGNWAISRGWALFPETTVIDSFLPSFLTQCHTCEERYQRFLLFHTTSPDTVHIHIFWTFVLVFRYSTFSSIPLVNHILLFMVEVLSRLVSGFMWGMSGPIKPLIIAHQRSFMLNCETKSEMESLGLKLRYIR